MFSAQFKQFLGSMAAKGFGPLGGSIFRRSYARTRKDQLKENWPQARARVTAGNLSFLRHMPNGDVISEDRLQEEEGMIDEAMAALIFMPGGRHLRQTGAPEGYEYVCNCHTIGWGDADTPEHHARDTFLALMQGGGVGGNYSNRYMHSLPIRQRSMGVQMYCRGDHPDLPEFSGEMSPLNGLGTVLEVEDSREGWVKALTTLLRSYWSEDDDAPTTIGFDISLIRPKGSPLRGFGGTASGPGPLVTMLRSVQRLMNEEVSLTDPMTSLQGMWISHYVACCVIAGNVRRSARMSVKHWKDPDIFEFIHCKDDRDSHWSTNISVEIDDDFILCVRAHANPSMATTEETAHAMRVLREVCSQALEHGEPGLWNSSLSSVGETGPLYATNPCGEEAMMQDEACDLGHLDVYRLWQYEGPDKMEMIDECWKLMVRFLIRATASDLVGPSERARVDANRRIGAGFLGFQGMLALMGCRYADVADNEPVRQILRRWYRVCREEANDYADILGINRPVKVTTLAPTGTTHKLAGSPPSAQAIIFREYMLRVRYSIQDEEFLSLKAEGYTTEVCQYDKSGNTGIVLFPMRDTFVQSLIDEHGMTEQEVTDLVQGQDELSLSQGLGIQAMLQENFVDNAVSFTHMLYPDNLPTADEMVEILIPYLDRVKGTTVMPAGGRPQSPYTRISAEEFRSHKGLGGTDSADDCPGGACAI